MITERVQYGLGLMHYTQVVKHNELCFYHRGSPERTCVPGVTVAAVAIRPSQTRGHIAAFIPYTVIYNILALITESTGGTLTEETIHQVVADGGNVTRIRIAFINLLRTMIPYKEKGNGCNH